MLQMIAMFLPDKDLASLSAVSKYVRSVIEHEHSGIWSVRFLETFDNPGIEPRRMMDVYRNRQKWLHRYINFDRGNEPAELEALKVLRELINGK